MAPGSKIFVPQRCLGYVSNHIPLQVRYIKNKKEHFIATCVGKSFHTYGINQLKLINVGGQHPSDILCMTSDTFHVYTACDTSIYAWRRSAELQHTYNGHKRPVHLMLPFGEHLIAVDENSNVKIWDIKDESLYLELTFTNELFKITAIVHPSTYINKILLGSEQGSMQLWNINTAKLIYTFKGWDSPITCLEQTPALDIVAVGLQNGKIILHDLKMDETKIDFTQDYGKVTSISFRTDGHDIMAVGSVNGNIVFWDLNERRVASQLVAHDDAVTGMVCLPNEPLVISSSPDNTLKLWIFDMTDGGARLLRLREGHSAAPNYIRFHGLSGCHILSAAGDSSLRIFSPVSEKFNKNLGKASYNRKSLKRKKRTERESLIMPPIVQFTSETAREKEWDSIAAIHSDLAVATSWSFNTTKMGDLKLRPNRKTNLKYGGATSACSIFLTHCGNFVIVGYTDGFADRFNMQSGLYRDTYGNPKAHEGPVRGVASDSLNIVAITGSSDLQLKFWKFKNEGSSPTTTLDIEESVNFFRTHHESSMLAVALENFSIIIIDIEVRNIVRKFEGHTAQLTDATFNPDSRWLITSSMDCSIRIWDIPSAQLVDQFKTESACISIDMSPTGELLATAHVDYLGIFLWTNRTLYSHVSLKALSPSDEPPNVVLPEIGMEDDEENEEILEEDDSKFISPEQISKDLVTLSDLPSSRWLNLLNIDLIKKRNKPKQPPKKPADAPFFLPTIPSLTFQFDLSNAKRTDGESKLLIPKDFLNLSQFGKALNDVRDDFKPIVEQLKSMGPSMIEQEIKNLSPDNGGSVEVMLQFFKSIEFMMKSNEHFELAQAYLGVFLKVHGQVIASNDVLRNYLHVIQNCHSASWEKIQKKFLYTLSIAQYLKTV